MKALIHLEDSSSLEKRLSKSSGGGKVVVEEKFTHRFFKLWPTSLTQQDFSILKSFYGA